MRQLDLTPFGTARLARAGGETIALPKPAFAPAFRLPRGNPQAALSYAEGSRFLLPYAPTMPRALAPACRLLVPELEQNPCNWRLDFQALADAS